MRGGENTTNRRSQRRFLIGDTYYAISGGKEQPLFKSKDLENWTYVGPFMKCELPGVVLGEDVSCPNFFPIGGPSTPLGTGGTSPSTSLGTSKWMLLCISHPHGCRYYLGEWDAQAEQFVPEHHARMNWPHEGQDPGEPMFLRDFFAPESVLTPDGRRVMWAWLATLDEELREKTIQSLPRELSLAEDGSLRMAPLRELETLRYDPVVMENVTATPPPRNNGGITYQHVRNLDGDAFEIRLTIAHEEAARKRFGVRLFMDKEAEGLPIVIQPASRTLRLGGTEAPFAVADLPEGEDVELRIFIDKYLVEVFANHRQAMVAAHMDWDKARGFDVYAFGAPVTFAKIEVWRMRPSNEGYLEARLNRIWEPDEE